MRKALELLEKNFIKAGVKFYWQIDDDSSEYDNLDEAIESAEENLASSYWGEVGNGEVVESEYSFTLIFEDKDEDEEEAGSFTEIIEYEHYHGDFKEHNTR